MSDFPRPTCSDGPIWDVWLAAFHAPTLAIADELGLFSAIHRQPSTPAEVARDLNITVHAAESMLGLMAALGFVAQAATRYHLTEVARTYLVPTSPYYWGGFLRRIRNVPLDCNKLIESLRRAQQPRVSEQLWRAPSPPPEALHAFTHAMHAHSFALAMRVVDRFDLIGTSRFLDVAGGSGSYAIAAALHDPQLRCTVIDLPPVCEIASDYIAKHGVSERVTATPVNMFSEPWPIGFDRVFFSDIFHDWADEQCRFLAARAFESLASGGRVLVHEMLLSDDKDGPLAAAAYSMIMVFVTEGRQRTAQELIDILASAGFIEPRVTMTAEGYALIEATKP
jgi:cyclopropane fatty-acyl-phospholipid synthase-like methyltransferase